MYIKILFLLYVLEGVSGRCAPCTCHDRVFPDSWGRVENFPWMGQRKNINMFYSLSCDGAKVNDIPSDTPNNIEAIWLLGDKGHPIARQNGLTRQMFERFRQLEILMLGNLEAQTMALDTFEPLGKAKHLVFGYNPFPLIPVGVFQRRRTFQTLFLGWNKITKILTGTFADMPELRLITLDNNNIELIEVGAFRNSPLLSKMDIEHNMLTYVDIKIFDNVELFSSVSFGGNRWVCNDDLCPFMYHAQKYIICNEPGDMRNKTFSDAIKYVGTKVDRVRHVKDLDQSVQMICTTCDYTEMHWRKEDNSSGLPPGASVKHSDRTTTLIIDKVNELHDGNYTCYNPTCNDCPKQVVALIVNIPEPNWNFSSRQEQVDEIVRFGDQGLVFGLIPLAVFSIALAVIMSGYFIYLQVKKNRASQQETQQDEEL